MSNLRSILTRERDIHPHDIDAYISALIGWADARCETRGKLTPELIAAIQDGIKEGYFSAKHFCACHASFTPGYISNLYKGKKQRITPKVAVLCDILKIKINEFVIL